MTEPRFDTYLQVRLTTHDKERIKARAIEAHMKTSEYVRARALGERIPADSVRKRALGEPARVFTREDITPTPKERQRVANALLLREAHASTALDGETMHENHPAVVEARESAELDASGEAGETLTPEQALQRKLEHEQLERNIRGSVGMQAPRNNP
jgi:hypothetical protein